ncbi:MAG: tetratricopeptide repeat protein, partial [Marinilabiliaceae bacterium]|nr:tetratricopeptide repeat protein [Marinilabiliaceae bacterium]
MSKYYYLFVLLFISSIISRGQDLPSSEIIAKGIELYDNGDYDEAIEKFLSVHENDSNYVYSQVELALCFLQTEEYDKLFQVGDRVLDEAGSYTPHLLFLLANGYDEASDPAKAISFYRKSLSLAPYDALTHYNMGVTYMNTGVLDSAYLCFQEAVRCNPLHASSHLGLGKLSARQGHLTKAILSLQTFLLIEPQSGRSNENLVYLENLANNYLDHSLGKPIEAFADNEGFEYYDHMIRAKIALNDEFESEIDLNVKYIKQTEMLYELKLFEQESDDFWCKAYFPFFKAVRQDGFFKHLAYLTLFSTNNETVVNWITKNSEEMQNFYQLGSYLNNIKNSREVSIDGKTKVLDCNFYDSGRIFSMGNRNKDGLEDGYWIYFYETGIKSGEGRFINGERTGEWKYYHEGGKLSSIEPYNNNKLDGKAKLFSEDGTLLSTAAFKDDQIVGGSISYFPCGQIQEETDYSKGDGTVNGYALYPNGDTSSCYKGINNLLEGEYISYFPKGRVSNITTYKDGVANGPYLNYSEKGTLLTEGNYENDK